MNHPPLLLSSPKPTEVFLILHEQARRPADREYEYMTGQLREALQEQAFGRPLTAAGERRAMAMGKRLSGLRLAFLITEDFVTPLETARQIARGVRGGHLPINVDLRICESNLSYLTRRRFQTLGKAEAAGDPNAAMRDWIQQRPDDFRRLVRGHIELWNDLVVAHAGRSFAMVLHVEGFVLYPTLLLGAPPERMVSLHIPRAHPIHVRLFPDHAPLLSFGDEAYWEGPPATIFGQYS